MNIKQTPIFTIIFLFMLFFGACTPDSTSTENQLANNSQNQANPLFEEISPKKSGLDFTNTIENTEKFNIFSYRNFYNGGGVAIGDVNNDGLADVYMTGNMVKNKLFLNKGNFEFEDITQKAGVGGERGWSTGVVMVDINNDKLLDIYVCNAGYVEGDDQKNELFINNGDLTFTEQSADFNLDEGGYTTHAAFFDYDLDGDLDVYLLNNSFIPVNTLNYSNKRDLKAEDWPVKDFLKGGGDKLLKNEGGKFTDVTEEAGIYSSLIGFGLGITVGDINGDMLPDMYVSNDFFERDYLYINDGKLDETSTTVTFTEDIKGWMGHLSLASMGADMADINNDGYPEIFVTEMLPKEDSRRKTTSSFENYNVYLLKQQRDFYHQYMHNTLQYNNKDQSFSEIAWYSGVAASDWSWGALLFDADNDGYRDIYVCNGIYQDVTDQDFIDFFSNEVFQKMAVSGEKTKLQEILKEMPSRPQLNQLFHNNGDLTFADKGLEFGFDEPSFSNGAAYGDLDNDGDLDLVVNNLNQESFLFKNNSSEQLQNHYVSVQLKGTAKNTFAIGSKVAAFAGGEQYNFQMIPTRGFQSSIDYKMVFGLGKKDKVDSLVVTWMDKTQTILQNPPIDTLLVVDYQESEKSPLKFTVPQKNTSVLFSEVSNSFEAHKEDRFIDFFQEGLTMRMLSREGPKAAIGDVNGDGLDDVFVGGAADFHGLLYLQKRNGQFAEPNRGMFEAEVGFEDTAAAFFDADGDGDLDLMVGSGGNHQMAGTRFMQDRLYFNDGKGNFTLNQQAFSSNGLNTSVIVPFDMDEDGDLDVFVGSRSIPNQYGVPARSYLYENDGKGNFKDVAKDKFKVLTQLGMVTDATLVDINQDKKSELVVVGEWMSPKVFSFAGGNWEELNTSLSTLSGWWYAIEAEDVDGDGDQDLILGNRGENFYFSGNPEAPAKLWLSDFDGNGTIEKIMTQTIEGRDVPVHLKKELTGQLAKLKKKNLKHSDYASKSIQELFSEDDLNKAYQLEATYFKSAVAINNGNGQFEIKALPKEVQFSCVCDIYCTDLNGDNQKDLILAGNDSGFTPQFSKLDGSFGHVLINKGDGSFERIENKDSGLFIRGDVKQLAELKIGGSRYILGLVNNEKSKLFKIN
ncbi:MAG: VCBS repeat-containing protein [Chitinophagales bacterium]